MVVTLSITLTWTHVVLWYSNIHYRDWYNYSYNISLDCNSLVISLSIVFIRELTCTIVYNCPTSAVGSYHCNIPTLSVYDDTDIFVRNAVYVKCIILTVKVHYHTMVSI